MSPVQFYREYNWCPTNHHCASQKPQKNPSKIKIYFFPENEQKHSNIYIYIQIRTVTRNQMHMDNRHIITMLDEMFHHVQHFLPICWHAQIFWQERQWPCCCVIWLWRNDCISGLIHVHSLRGHWPSIRNKPDIVIKFTTGICPKLTRKRKNTTWNHGHHLRPKKCSYDFSRVSTKENYVQKLISERPIIAESTR